MQRLLRLIVPAVVVILAVVMIVFFVRSRPPVESEQTAEGVRYLKQLEEADIQAAEEIFARQRQERLAAEREETMRKVESGEINVWSLFNDYVLMGDSRAVGFSAFDYMPADRVIAGGGWTIRDIELHLDEIRAVNPSSIYLCFGLNDTSIGYWETPEPYAEEYLQVIRMLEEEFPNATVYVNSIFPARDPAFAQSQKWYDIPKYSAAVGEMCRANGIHFVNNDDLAVRYADLWDEDGIHLQKEFYPYWAANMIMTMYGEDPAPSDGAGTSSGSAEASSEEAEDAGGAEE